MIENQYIPHVSFLLIAYFYFDYFLMSGKALCKGKIILNKCLRGALSDGVGWRKISPNGLV